MTRNRKQIIRLTESDLHRIVKESVESLLTEMGDEMQKTIYTPRETEELYNNQGNLTPMEDKVLRAAMWVRAMNANYHGYAKEWPNIMIKDGEILYFNKNREWKRIGQ